MLYPVAVGLSLAVALAWVWARALRRPMRLDAADRAHGPLRGLERPRRGRAGAGDRARAAVGAPRRADRPARRAHDGARAARRGSSAAGTSSTTSRAAATRSPTSARMLDDPFGLERVELRLPNEGTLLVYPRLVDLDGVFSQGIEAHQGRRLAMWRPAGFDLHSVREYQQGESLRKVHWPTHGAPRRADGQGLRRRCRATRSPCSSTPKRPRSSAPRRTRASRRRCAPPARSCRRTSDAGRRSVLVVNSAQPAAQEVHTHGAEWRQALELLASVEPDGPEPRRQPPGRRGGARGARARARRRHGRSSTSALADRLIAARPRPAPRVAGVRRRGELRPAAADDARAAPAEAPGGGDPASRSSARRRPRRGARPGAAGGGGAWLGRSCSTCCRPSSSRRTGRGSRRAARPGPLPLDGRARARSRARPAALGTGAGVRGGARRSRPGSRSSSRSSTRGRSAARTSSARSARGSGVAFEAFFEVALPFDASERPAMHGAILLAVFAFCARPGAGDRHQAAAARLGGPDRRRRLARHDRLTARRARARRDRPRGRAPPVRRHAFAADARRSRQPLLAARRSCSPRWSLSTSPSVAKGEFVDGWRTWDVSIGEGPLGRRRVRLERELRRDPLPAEADDRALDRRARSGRRVLARDDARRLHARSLDRGALRRRRARLRRRPPGPVERSVPPAMPRASATRGSSAEVQVEGLRDTHLSAPASRSRTTPGPARVDYFFGNVAIVARRARARRLVHRLEPCAQPTPQQLGALSARTIPTTSTGSLPRARGNSGAAVRARPAASSACEQLFARNPRLGEYAERLHSRPATWSATPAAPTRPSSRSRAGSGPAATSPTTSSRRGRRGTTAAGLVRALDPARVLPALRRRDGADAAAARHPGTRGGRLHLRPLRRRRRIAGSSPTATRTPGSKPGSTASGGCRSIRRPAAGARRHVHVLVAPLRPRRLPRRGGRAAARATCCAARPAAPIARAARIRAARPRRLAGGGGGARLGNGHRHAPALARAPALRSCSPPRSSPAAAAASSHAIRAGIAGACRRDLVGFIADQGVPVPESATPVELGEHRRAPVRRRPAPARGGADARPLRAAGDRGSRRRPCAPRATRAAQGPPRPAERPPPDARAPERPLARRLTRGGDRHGGRRRPPPPPAHRDVAQAVAADRRPAGDRDAPARARGRRADARDGRHRPPRRAARGAHRRRQRLRRRRDALSVSRAPTAPPTPCGWRSRAASSRPRSWSPPTPSTGPATWPVSPRRSRPRAPTGPSRCDGSRRRPGRAAVRVEGGLVRRVLDDAGEAALPPPRSGASGRRSRASSATERPAVRARGRLPARDRRRRPDRGGRGRPDARFDASA